MSTRVFSDQANRLKTRVAKLGSSKKEGKAKRIMNLERQQLVDACQCDILKMEHCKSLMQLYVNCLEGDCKAALFLGDSLLDNGLASVVASQAPCPPKILIQYASMKSFKLSSKGDFDVWVGFVVKTLDDLSTRSRLGSEAARGMLCNALLARLQRAGDDGSTDDDMSGEEEGETKEHADGDDRGRDVMLSVAKWLSPLLASEELQDAYRRSEKLHTRVDSEKEEEQGQGEGEEEEEEEKVVDEEESDFEPVHLSQEPPAESQPAANGDVEVQRESPVESLVRHMPDDCREACLAISKMLLMMLGGLGYEKTAAEDLAHAFKTDSENELVRAFVTSPLGLIWTGEFNDWVVTAGEAEGLAEKVTVASSAVADLKAIAAPRDFSDLSQWQSAVWKGGKDLSALAALFQQVGQKGLANHPALREKLGAAAAAAETIAKLPAESFASALVGEVLKVEGLPDISQVTREDLKQQFKPLVVDFVQALAIGSRSLQKFASYFEQNGTDFGPMAKLCTGGLSNFMASLVEWLAGWRDGLHACESMVAHGTGCEDFPLKYQKCNALRGATFPAAVGCGQEAAARLSEFAALASKVAVDTRAEGERQALSNFKDAVGDGASNWPMTFDKQVVVWADTSADDRENIEALAEKSPVPDKVLQEVLVHVEAPDDKAKCECLVLLANFKISWSRATKKFWAVGGTECTNDLLPVALVSSVLDLSTSMAKVQSFIDGRATSDAEQSPLKTPVSGAALIESLGDVMSDVSTMADSCVACYQCLLVALAKHGEDSLKPLLDKLSSEFKGDFRDWAWTNPDETEIEQALKVEPKDVIGISKSMLLAIGGIKKGGLAGNVNLGILGVRLSALVKKAEDLDVDGRLYVATHGGLKIIAGASRWAESKLGPRKRHYLDLIKSKNMYPDADGAEGHSRLPKIFVDRVQNVEAQGAEPTEGTPKTKASSSTPQSKKKGGEPAVGAAATSGTSKSKQGSGTPKGKKK